MQPQFDELEGVERTVVGYTGGTNPKPTYKSVCDDDGHTEAVRVEYNPKDISYQDLLDRFWETYVGPGGKAQYMTAIWCEDEEQLQLAKKSLKEQQASDKYQDMSFMVRDGAIKIEMARPWTDAEPYHQYHAFGGPCKS